MIFIIMGVSGAGKTTVGKMLSEKIRSEFYDADHFHPKENIEKMSKGIPLRDADRELWLKSIQFLIEVQNGDAVLACSALKQSYRDILNVPDKNVVFVYLKGEKELLRKRLVGRKGHYAGSNLLDSQLETLEEPQDALTLDIGSTPEVLVEEIIKEYGHEI
ncbi:MAG: gluconokinase [Thermodesulfobacteriota bacterium]|nr:MAG: gluconokinase [Thermodesulfobacteriota bacterium]